MHPKSRIPASYRRSPFQGRAWRVGGPTFRTPTSELPPASAVLLSHASGPGCVWWTYLLAAVPPHRCVFRKRSCGCGRHAGVVSPRQPAGLVSPKTANIGQSDIHFWCLIFGIFQLCCGGACTQADCHHSDLASPSPLDSRGRGYNNDYVVITNKLHHQVPSTIGRGENTGNPGFIGLPGRVQILSPTYDSELVEALGSAALPLTHLASGPGDATTLDLLTFSVARLCDS